MASTSYAPPSAAMASTSPTPSPAETASTSSTPASFGDLRARASAGESTVRHEHRPEKNQQEGALAGETATEGASAGESSVSVGESRVSTGQDTRVLHIGGVKVKVTYSERVSTAPPVPNPADVRSLRNNWAMTTILRSTVPLLDYFNLDGAKFLGELSLSWWRELGCWALVKGSKGHAIVGDASSFVPARVADLEKGLKECRKARPLDEAERASADLAKFSARISEAIRERASAGRGQGR